MMNEKKYSALEIIVAICAVIACVAAVLVVPEFRRLLGLEQSNSPEVLAQTFEAHPSVSSGNGRFTLNDINAALGINNWKCFPDRIDGVSLLDVPSEYVVKYPIAKVDKQGVAYFSDETVPAGGNATAWLDGQLASRNECPP